LGECRAFFCEFIEAQPTFVRKRSATNHLSALNDAAQSREHLNQCPKGKYP